MIFRFRGGGGGGRGLSLAQLQEDSSLIVFILNILETCVILTLSLVFLNYDK